MSIERLQEWSDFCDELGWEFVGDDPDDRPIVRLKSGAHVHITAEMREDIERAISDARSEAATEAVREAGEMEW